MLIDIWQLQEVSKRGLGVNHVGLQDDASALDSLHSTSSRTWKAMESKHFLHIFNTKNLYGNDTWKLHT
jgi:hypothetical protein